MVASENPHHPVRQPLEESQQAIRNDDKRKLAPQLEEEDELLEVVDIYMRLPKTALHQTDEEQEFEVEKIISSGLDDYHGGLLFLVKWLGYPNSENTWEPRSHLTNCDQKLEEYYQLVEHS